MNQLDVRLSKSVRVWRGHQLEDDKPDAGGSEAVQQAYVTARGMNPKDNGMQVDGMAPAGWNPFAPPAWLVFAAKAGGSNGRGSTER
jgi:hypothetical protein